MNKLSIFTFSYPCIYWGEEPIPVVSLITEPIKMSMNNSKICKKSGIEIESEYALHFNNSSRQFIVSPNNGVRSARHFYLANNVFLVYRRLSPFEGESWINIEISLMEDTKALKIVSSGAFIAIYESITGRKYISEDKEEIKKTIEEMKKGNIPDDIAKFILKHRFISPFMLGFWNKSPILRKYLPYNLFISISDGDSNNDNNELALRKIEKVRKVS
jgi:hypothetical protein